MANKNEESEAYIFYWLIPIIIIIVLSIKFVPGFFADRADKKAKCRTHHTVTEAKTDFVAKHAFKKCMKK